MNVTVPRRRAVGSVIYFGMGDDGPPWLPKLCLLDERFQPKPAFDRLKHLIQEEWMTRAAGITGADGVFSFRGFLGDYDVFVTEAGRTQAFKVKIGKSTRTSVTLVRL